MADFPVGARVRIGQVEGEVVGNRHVVLVRIDGVCEAGRFNPKFVHLVETAAPNQTAAEPGPVADSELRDRIAEKLTPSVNAPSTGAFGSDAEYATWASNGVMDLVAPVLAERDELKRQLEDVTYRHGERRTDCDRVKDAIGPVLYRGQDWSGLRAGWMAKEAMQALSDARAEIDRLRRNADRDARMVDGLRGERITLWEERDKAATALAAIKDWKWERPPTLPDRIELVASELNIARRERDALKADQGIRAGALADVLGVGRNRSVEGYYALVERVARMRAELDQWRTGPVVAVDRNDLVSGVGSQPDSEPRCAEPKGMSICGIELSDDGWCPDHGEVGPPVEATEQAEPWKCGECKVVNSPDAKTCELCLSEAGPVVVVDQPGGET